MSKTSKATLLLTSGPKTAEWDFMVSQLPRGVKEWRSAVEPAAMVSQEYSAVAFAQLRTWGEYCVMHPYPQVSVHNYDKLWRVLDLFREAKREKSSNGKDDYDTM